MYISVSLPKHSFLKIFLQALFPYLLLFFYMVFHFDGSWNTKPFHIKHHTSTDIVLNSNRCWVWTSLTKCSRYGACLLLFVRSHQKDKTDTFKLKVMFLFKIQIVIYLYLLLYIYSYLFAVMVGKKNLRSIMLEYVP